MARHTPISLSPASCAGSHSITNGGRGAGGGSPGAPGTFPCIPQAQEIVAAAIAGGGAKAASAQGVRQLIDATLASDQHRWFLGQLTTEEKAERKRQRDEFKKRYVVQPPG